MQPIGDTYKKCDRVDEVFGLTCLPVCVAVQINSDCEDVFCVVLFAYVRLAQWLFLCCFFSTSFSGLLGKITCGSYQGALQGLNAHGSLFRLGCPCCRGRDCGTKTSKVNMRQVQARHGILCLLQRGQSSLAAVAGRQAFVNSDVCARRACVRCACACVR